MPNSLSRRLAALFRSKADLTSLKKLEREGIRTVNVIDLSRIEAIVGEAIEKVVREAADAGTSPTFVAEGAQVEFLRLLGQGGRLKKKGDELAAASDQLTSNLESLQASLDRSKAELSAQADQSERGAFEALRARVDRSLEEAFDHARRALPSDGAAGAAALAALQAPLRASMLELLGSALHRGRAPVDPTADEAQVELLERRVKKLTAQLLETQELLARTRDERLAEEQAQPSIYKTVQGLTGAEQNGAQRKSLMRAIFEHNLELRRTLTERPRGSESSHGT